MGNWTWLGLLQSLGVFGIMVSALAYVFKKNFESYLNSKIDQHRIILEKDSREHMIRYERLHAERAEVIKIFYGKLVEFDKILGSTLNPFQAVGEPELEQKVVQLADKFNEMLNYYLPNKIFFSKALCSKIDELINISHGIFLDITVFPVSLRSPMYQNNFEGVKNRAEF
jgi:hypothetical protein